MESSQTLDLQVTKKCLNKNGVNTLITMGTEPKKKKGMPEVRSSMAVTSKTLTEEFIISI